MKRLLFIIAVGILSLSMSSVWTAFAQTPKVPITYSGDTDETIDRRVKWIEGAKREKKMVWWGSGRPSTITNLLSEFNKIYPYIKVDYWRGQDVNRMMKVEEEHSVGRYNVDINEPGAPENFPRWREMGIPAKYVEIIPEIDKWDKRMYSKFGDWAMPEYVVITPQYNTNLVSKEDAPKSWEDLLDPKWKGQMGLTTDLKAWIFLALSEGGWGIERTEAFLEKLQKQNLIWTSGHSAGFTLMIAGEFKILVENYLHHIIKLQGTNAPADWVRVKTVPVAGTYFMLLNNAPHPNAARLFTEWYFSPYGIAIIEKEAGKGSTFPGSGTRQAKALVGKNLIYKSEEVVVKAKEMGLYDRFASLLGVVK